jgi:L-2-hydroxyglutarate oxidase LhgO
MAANFVEVCVIGAGVVGLAIARFEERVKKNTELNIVSFAI